MSDSSAGALAGGIIGAAVLGFASGGTLTAAGFALGSKIGGTLAQDDPDAIRAPGLDDTNVQSDEVGSPLPWVYGTQRVPGFRDWVENGQLRTEIVTSGGGSSKGGGPSKPERETPKYYVTFMAVLAEVPEGSTYRLRRLWLDAVNVVDARSQGDTSDAEYAESLIAANPIPQGAVAGEVAATDSEKDTVGQIIFLDGSEDQQPPARMVADKGPSPGYRGRACVYFEDLALEDYGSRVPTVSAELVEDGTGDTIQVAYQKDVDHIDASIFDDAFNSITPKTFWIDDGLLVYNIPPTGDGRHINDESPYFDLSVAPDGSLVDITPNDVDTIGINPDNELSPPFGYGWSSLVAEKKAFYSRFLLPIHRYVYTSHNNDDDDAEDSALISIWYDLLLASPYDSPHFDFYDRRRDDEVDTLGCIVTPDRENIIVFHNRFDGTSYYKRFSFGDGFEHGFIEQGEIIPDGPLPQLFAGLNASNRSNAALAMMESNLGRLWGVFIKESEDHEVVILRRDINGDYRETVRDTVNASRLFRGGIADGGVARFVQNGVYTIVTLGLISAETTTLSRIVSELCERVGLEPSEYDTSLLTQEVRGYTAKETTAQSVIGQLRQMFPFDVRDSGYKIEFIPRGQSSVMTLTDEDLQAREPGSEMPPTVAIKRQPETDMPREAELRYSDIDRRLEDNLQRQTRQSVRAEGKISVQAPIAFDSQEAVRVVDVLLKNSWADQTSYDLVGTTQLLELEPADVVDLDTTPVKGQARIARIDDGDPGLRKIEASPEGAAQYSSAAESESGEPGNDGATIGGPTRAIPLDLPALTTDALRPGLYFGLGAPLDAWPGGSLVVYNNDNASTIDSKTTRAIIGLTSTVLPDGPTTVFDRGNTVRVRLTAGSLSSVTESEVLNGANVLAISTADALTRTFEDWEIIQFADAVQVSADEWELSTLLRGRRGTERLTDQHTGTGARIVLLTGLDGIGFAPRDEATVGEDRGYAGVTFGNLPPPTPDFVYTYKGRNLEPLSPVQVKGNRNSSDDLTISWTRRTRQPSDFLDTKTAPLREETEEYEIDILDGGTVVRTLTSTSESVTYTAADQTTDFGSTQTSVDVAIYQMSAIVGRGWPAQETI